MLNMKLIKVTAQTITHNFRKNKIEKETLLLPKYSMKLREGQQLHHFPKIESLDGKKFIYYLRRSSLPLV